MSIDLVSDLPVEISQIIFLGLAPKTLLNCRRVSKSWKQIADNDYIWKSKFEDQKSWKYYKIDDDSETDSWYELYKERYLLKLNWKNDRFTRYKFSDPYKAFCVKFFKNWIFNGLAGCTIRIWDSDTFQCIKVLGEPNFEILKQLGAPNLQILRENLSAIEILELTKDIDIKFHLSEVSCMEINDKYLVSGSWDGSCIIWTLPDFEPIDRLILPGEIGPGLFINDVAIYNDYIVCCTGDGYIGVWKSNFENSEHQLQFNLQHRLKENRPINNICIRDGIIYGARYNAVITINIETGQRIQEFQLDEVGCIVVKDQYFFVSEYDKITIWDLQSNKLINILSDRRVYSLCINNNRFISVDDAGTIKIRNLDDQKLLKEYRLSSSPVSSVYIDSKRIAFTTECDLIIFDFTEGLRKKYLKYF